MGAIGANPADTAFVAMVNAAKTSVRMSQQDLGPIAKLGVSFDPWPEALMSALISAMGRGVDVNLVLSNPGSTPGDVSPLTTSYSTGNWSLADVAGHFKSIATAHPDLLPSGTDPVALLCDKLHLAHLRSSSADAWPDGRTLANHAKLIVVDDRAFYLGSQNAYIVNLAEHGFIVDDETATKTVVKDYYEQLWTYSKATLATGSDAPACVLDNQ
jgi:phosphatidylserine/phosphatidylglycerophosphate/cardiolipin synthase-like enzyme